MLARSRSSRSRLGAPAFVDERTRVGGREISAGRDQKRAAAHRGVDDSQGEDGIRGRAGDEGGERAPDDESGERLRRVERARLLPPRAVRAGANVSIRAVVVEAIGIEIEHALIHGAELLDAKVGVVDALEPCAPRPHPERDERALHRGVPPGRSRRGVRPRRPGFERTGRRACEQPSVERRDDEIVDAAAGTQQARDCRQALPEPDLMSTCGRRPALRAQRVRSRVEGMRARHEVARLGEEQKQHAIDERQRFVERAGARRDDRPKGTKRLRDAELQVGADAILKSPGRGDQRVEAADRSPGRRIERAGVRERPERREAARIEDVRQAKLEAAPRRVPANVHEREKRRAEQKTPVGADSARRRGELAPRE